MFCFVICCLTRVAREGLLEKVTFEQTPEGIEEAKCVTLWGKSILGRGTSQCEGSEVGACLECSGATGEVSRAGAEGTRDRWVICEVREVGGVADYAGVSVSS